MTAPAILSLAFALGCDGRIGAPVTPTPSAVEASVTINLTTPNAGDGAVLFTITGPSILGVAVRPGLEVAESRVTANGETTSTVLVRGDLASGAIGELRVRGADVNAVYTTQVRQVAAGAGGDYALRTNLSAYRLTMLR